MSLTILHVDQLGGAPWDLYRHVIAAHTEMMNARTVHKPTSYAKYVLICDLADAVPIHWDQRAVVAIEEYMHPPDLLGFIIYGRVEYIKQYNISLGYVHPLRRHQGIYRQLWDVLVEKARDKGYRKIYGTTKVDNVLMREIAKKLGRVEESINLEFTL